MKKSIKTTASVLIMSILFVVISCKPATERSGVVVDSKTGEPIAGVSVEIYMKDQVKDSLPSKVSTRKDGTFLVSEKRPKDQLFILEKGGYISHVSSLFETNDTIRMLKIEYYNQ